MVTSQPGAVDAVSATRSGLGSLRWPFAIFAAAAMTFALFALMQRLIASDIVTLAEPEPGPVIFINFTVPAVDPSRRVVEFVDVEPVDPPPTPPRLDTRDTAPDAMPMHGDYVRPVLDPQEILGAEAIAVPPPPLTIRESPVYPQGALNRGQEGDCMVSYDILASGRTANIQVLRCDTDAFARATIAAVERWRHAADTTQAPGAVVRRGMVTELNFRLE